MVRLNVIYTRTGDNGETGLKSVRLLRKVFGEGLPAIVLTADRTPDVAEAVTQARC